MDRKNSQKRPDMVFGCIPMNLFAESVAFIHAVRAGIPGHWLASVIQSSGADEGIAKAFGIPTGQLEAMCQMDSLDTRASEAVLEIARVLSSCFVSWKFSSCPHRALSVPISESGSGTFQSLTAQRQTLILDAYALGNNIYWRRSIRVQARW